MSEIVLLYPNDTKVTIEGDDEVIKQIVDRLDGLVINYQLHFKQYSSLTDV